MYVLTDSNVGGSYKAQTIKEIKEYLATHYNVGANWLRFNKGFDCVCSEDERFEVYKTDGRQEHIKELPYLDYDNANFMF